MTTVVLPTSLTTIGTSAFDYCADLTSLTSLPVLPPEAGEYFLDLHRLSPYAPPIEIRVPAASVEAYKTAYR